jgi:hypothetical protein
MNSIRMASEKWILSGLATMSVALVVPSNSRAGDLAGAVQLCKEFIEGASGAFFSRYTKSELGTILRYLQEGRSAQEANMARVKMLRMNLDRTFRRALTIAEEQHHELATPAHLLLALTGDPDAAPVMQACDVDLDKLRFTLSSSLSSEGTAANGAAPSPDARFRAVVRRAVVHVQSIGKNQEISGAHVLAAILVSTPAEPAAEFLSDQGMTRFDALSYISHGLRKGEVMLALDGGDPATGAAMLEGVVRQSFSHGRTKPVVVEKVKRRRPPRDGKTAKDAK